MNTCVIAVGGLIFCTLSFDRTPGLQNSEFSVLDGHLRPGSGPRRVRSPQVYPVCVCVGVCVIPLYSPPCCVTRWWLRIMEPPRLLIMFTLTLCLGVNVEPSPGLGHLVRIIAWHQLNARWTAAQPTLQTLLAMLLDMTFLASSCLF